MADLHEDELASVAIFPLPGLVLFPHARLPLHIFEPRYRAMMADVLASRSHLIAVAQLQTGRQQDYAGQPPIFRVAGIGRLERSEHNADGTYDIELIGLARAQLDELPMSDKPYRRARATLLRDTAAEGFADNDLAALYALAAQVVASVRKREPRFRLLAAADDPAVVMIDKISDQLVGDAAERQRLLETLDAHERLTRLSALMAKLQLTLLAGEGNGSSGMLH
jgi:Lon protease-like protein